MFVVDFLKDGCHKKRKLSQMKDKVVHFIYEDPYDCGFYILCSREYDQRLELEHTHRQEIFMNFERQVEPGIINIFDMNVFKMNMKDNQFSQSIEVRFIGMRDDEFNFDKCAFTEHKIKNPDQTSDEEWIYKQELQVMDPHIFGQISSFDINWPYIAFSGMEDYLVVINVHE